MLKLIKYEFRKMRTTLLVLALALAALEVVYLLGLKLDKSKMYGISLAVIGFLVFGVYAYVLIAGVIGYARELSNRTGYLLFMAPVRPLSIIIGKLFATMVIAVCAVAAFGAVAYLDVDMLLRREGLYEKRGLIDWALLSIGADLTVSQILLLMLYGALYALTDMLLFISTAYLAITLAVTLLENKKGFVRGLVSVILYIAITFGIAQLAGVWIIARINMHFDSLVSVLLSLWPLFALYLGCGILFCWLSALLLDRKVSL